MNFISRKVGRGKIVNLDNVSSIGFESNYKGNKVIFNFSHSITIDNGMMVSDYDYWKVSENESDEIMEDILSRMELFVSNDNRHKLVNPEKVSNISFDERNNRIIFNLNFSKEIRVQGSYQLSSDFIYWDYDTKEEYEFSIKKLKEQVGIN